MDRIKAIIVDDEEAARNVLRILIHRAHPEIEILAEEGNLPMAAEKIKSVKPDVVFLDVEMPGYAGYELPSFIKEIDFEIIFVTAFDKYAIQAFELNAIDFLVKPVSRSRLSDAIERLKLRTREQRQIADYRQLLESMKKGRHESLIISELGQKRVLQLNTIIAINAQGAYCKVFLTDDSPLLVSKNLKYFEGALPEEGSFFRSHKSWIINLKKIKAYQPSDQSVLLDEGISARISKYRKQAFEHLFDSQ